MVSARSPIESRAAVLIQRSLESRAAEDNSAGNLHHVGRWDKEAQDVENAGMLSSGKM